jgi:hypothetical protein
MDYGSPAENQNKGYAKQEKKDLLNDDPIARDASSGRPMILKHMSGLMGSSPAKMHHGSMAKMLKGDQVKLDANKNGKIDGEDFKILRK